MDVNQAEERWKRAVYQYRAHPTKANDILVKKTWDDYMELQNGMEQRNYSCLAQMFGFIGFIVILLLIIGFGIIAAAPYPY